MTYDPIDANDDGIVESDVDNESVNTEQLTNIIDKVCTSSQQFEDAIKNVSNGEVIGISGEIVTTGWVDIDGVSNVKLVGLSDGATIKRGTGVDAGVVRIGDTSTVTDISITGVDIDGNDPHQNNGSVVNGHGVFVKDAVDVTIKDLEVRDTPENSGTGDADNSAGIVALYPSEDILIDNCKIVNTGYRGIESSADTVTVRDCQTRDMKERHISPSAVRLDGRLSQNVTIRNVVMRKGSGSDVGSHISTHASDTDVTAPFGASTGDPLTNLTIENVKCYGQKRAGVAVRQPGANDGPITINNVWIEDSANDGVVIADRTNTDNPDTIQDISASVSNVTVETCVANGIYIDLLDGAKVENVTVKNAGERGINLQAVSNCIVRNCEIRSTGDEGILVGQLGDNSLAPVGVTLTDCKVINAGLEGIQVSTVSGTGSDNAVESCYVLNPNQDAASSIDGISINSAVSKGNSNTIQGGNNIRHGLFFAGDGHIADGNIVKGYQTNAVNQFNATGTIGDNET